MCTDCGKTRYKRVGLCDTSLCVVAEIFIFAGQLTEGCGLRWCNSTLL
jgi:hypothetical protein